MQKHKVDNNKKAGTPQQLKTNYCGPLLVYITDFTWSLKVIFLGDFSFVRMFLKNYRVTMTTTLDTSCSENTMVLSARRGFLHACIF
jgi:hypothetical protein